MSDQHDDPTRPKVRRRSILAAGIVGATGLWTLGSTPTVTAQPTSWARAGADEATQLVADLWGPDAASIAQVAGESAVEGVDRLLASTPEHVLTESVCRGITYGAVTGTSVTTISQGVPDIARVRNAARGATEGGMVAVTRHQNVDLSIESPFVREGYIIVNEQVVPLLPEWEEDEEPRPIADYGPFMRCPTWGGASGALTRGSVFLHPYQSPQTTYDAAFAGVNAGVDFYVATQANWCNQILNTAFNAAVQFYG